MAARGQLQFGIDRQGPHRRPMVVVVKCQFGGQLVSFRRRGNGQTLILSFTHVDSVPLGMVQMAGCASHLGLVVVRGVLQG